MKFGRRPKQLKCKFFRGVVQFLLLLLLSQVAPCEVAMDGGYRGQWSGQLIPVQVRKLRLRCTCGGYPECLSMLAAWAMYMTCPGRRVAPGGLAGFSEWGLGRSRRGQEAQALPFSLARPMDLLGLALAVIISEPSALIHDIRVIGLPL